MRVFVTGATGWVGSVGVDELLSAGHQVLGLSRSEKKAQGLVAKGARVLRGTLDYIDQFAEAAGNADGVIHIASNHDFSKFAENVEQERRAIVARGEALCGTDKPILVTSGLALLAPGRVVTETDMPRLSDPLFPRKNEAAVAALDDRSRDGCVSLHRNGTNRWPAVHVSDRAAISFGAGSGCAGPRLSCERGKGCCFPCDRRGLSAGRSTCPSSAPARTFRLAWRFCRDRRARVECPHTRIHRLAAQRPEPALRPRPAQ